ncbi:MAG: haloacid dehalogenase [Anaerolineaceae bacterium]
MENFEAISEKARKVFEDRTLTREQALALARQITRNSAHTIRAIHRNEAEPARELLQNAFSLVEQTKTLLANYPDLYYAGYTQDAIKEFVEASITSALIQNQSLPGPEQLDVEMATYLNGLAEVTGELRRRCLDILRQGYSEEAERLLGLMDEIYLLLVTLDFPDAVTNGLRRQTDLVRGIVERTRGDLTISLRTRNLEQAMQELTRRLDQPEE